MDTPLFESSFLGYELKVYHDRFTYRMMWGLGGTITVQKDQIASVSGGLPFMSQIEIETTGGKTYKPFVLFWKKEQALKAIHHE